MRFNYIPAPRSIYSVCCLRRKHVLPATWDEPDVRRYWTMADIALQSRINLPEGKAIGAAEALMRDAVRRRMVADVPLGALPQAVSTFNNRRGAYAGRERPTDQDVHNRI